MFWLYGSYCISVNGGRFIYPGKDLHINVMPDEHLDKKERHYDAWCDVFAPILPTYDNQIPERYSWKMRQPAYLDDGVMYTASYLFPAIIGSRRAKPVQWVTIS